MHVFSPFSASFNLPHYIGEGSILLEYLSTADSGEAELLCRCITCFQCSPTPSSVAPPLTMQPHPLLCRDDLREHLKNTQKLIMAQKQVVSSSDTDSSDSDSDSSE